jgi:hypothetical protein
MFDASTVCVLLKKKQKISGWSKNMEFALCYFFKQMNLTVFLVN